MHNLFIQYKTHESKPERSGWYDTDKGSLYFHDGPNVWSCRDDKISEEYPKLFYIKYHGPQ